MKLLSGRIISALGAGFLAFGTSSGHADGCSLKSLDGEWAYSEQGATKLGANPSVPFSEVGWFQLNTTGSGLATGTGTGEAFLSINGSPTSPPGSTTGIPLQITTVKVNATNCIGTAAFIAGTDTTHPRTITFTIFSAREFHYISTTGDITVLGVANKR